MDSFRWHLADDRGWLCSWDHVDWQTGCCARGQQFFCDRYALADTQSAANQDQRRLCMPELLCGLFLSRRTFCRCNTDNRCCETLESCVSCCLAPGNNASSIYNQDYRSPGRSVKFWSAKQPRRCPTHAWIISWLFAQGMNVTTSPASIVRQYAAVQYFIAYIVCQT